MSHLKKILWRNASNVTAEKDINTMAVGEYFADCTLTSAPVFASTLVDGTQVAWRQVNAVVTHTSQNPVYKIDISWSTTPIKTGVTCSSADKAYKVTSRTGNTLNGSWVSVSTLVIGDKVWGYSGSLGGANLSSTTGSISASLTDTTSLPTLYTVQKASPHNVFTVCFMGRMAVSGVI